MTDNIVPGAATAPGSVLIIEYATAIVSITHTHKHTEAVIIGGGDH